MKKLLAKQQVRFLIAGSLNTLLDFLVLNALTIAFGLPVLVSNTISVALGITVSYMLQHFFVFRYPHRITAGKFFEFVLFTGFSSLILQNLIIFGFEQFFNTNFGNSLLLLPTVEGRHVLGLNVAKAVAVLIGLVWNFFFYRFVIFRAPKKVADEVEQLDVPPAALVSPEPGPSGEARE